MVYLVNSRSRGTRAVDETEDDYFSISGRFIRLSTLEFINPCRFGTVDDDVIEDGMVIKSSNLSLQPLNFRVPYTSSALYALNGINTSGTNGNTWITGNTLELRAIHSGRVEVATCAGPDMKFFYQISPPVDFIPTP